MFQKEIGDKTLNLYLNEGYEKTITKKYSTTYKKNNKYAIRNSTAQEKKNQKHKNTKS